MTPEILMRDLVQARVLGAIFARSLKHEVVLKGGMALRALFCSERLTKDIDLAQEPGRPLAGLQKLMRAAIADATRGVLQDVVVSEPKQTATVARWKVHGNTPTGTHVGLTIEVSRRGFPKDHITHKTYQPAGARMPAVTIDVYDAEAIAASKVFALASENRVAVRDLFDLDLLIRMEVRPPPSLFDGVKDKAALIKDVWTKIELMSWPQFQNDVMPYMDESARSRFDAARFADMQAIVGVNVESWLTDDDDRHRSPSPVMDDEDDDRDDAPRRSP